ncbi:MAG TPA: Smr/MutS family protein [Burkholderiaceae bacterium]|nr:Smr/MutS family protein [Burkholderiaceae bacterium]
MATRLKTFDELGALRAELERRERAREAAERERLAAARAVARESGDFHEAMKDVAPLRRDARHVAPLPQPPPHPRQRQRDDRAVLQESVSDEIDIESLLETDDALSYRRAGIGPDVLRRLRRGEWIIQDQLDLHGHRVDEARIALAEFLREAVRRGVRCVRVIHGKGLGSKGREPVLKNKVRGWLVQREAVIAFCQARAPDGGAGALIVLLRPTRT